MLLSSNTVPIRTVNCWLQLRELEAPDLDDGPVRRSADDREHQKSRLALGGTSWRLTHLTPRSVPACRSCRSHLQPSARPRSRGAAHGDAAIAMCGVARPGGTLPVS